MTIKDKSLKQFNTFGFDAKCSLYSAPETVEKIKEVLRAHKGISLFVLGGGSNILFSKDFDGLILKPNIKSIEIEKENSEYVWVRVGAGMVWDEFVNYAVDNNLGGIENLSAIPGNVGAAPVQNVGAYGMEAKDTITTVEGIYIDNLASFKLSNSECKFGYRNSVFKNELKQKIVVTHVVFKLSKIHTFVLDYGNIKDELGKEINLNTIRKTIINIRTNKLPDPKILGNAGSFYKNPVIAKEQADKLIAQYPQMPFYPLNSEVKIPAGWLIEQCGLKGFRIGNVGIHEKQALVLVNYGEGTAKELINLSNLVREKVFSQFEITIEPEVIVV